MQSRFTNRRFRWRRRWPQFAAYLALLVSCSGPLASDEAQVQRIELTPTAVELGVGQTRTVLARVFGDGGGELSSSLVFWSTEDATVATVTQQGQITAVSLGTTQVAASAGGVSSLVTVTVSARPVARVNVNPPAPQVIAGSTIQLAAEALDAAGGVITGRTFTWLTSDPTIASVNLLGVVAGVSVGTTTIHAVTGGVEGSVVVTVLPVPIVPVAQVVVSPDPAVVHVGSPYARLFSATTKDAQGVTLGGRPVTWSSLNPAVATVVGGLVTGVSPGTTRIRALSEGVEGFADVTVDLVDISAVDVTPSTVTLPPTQSTTLQATPRDSAGSGISGAALGGRGTTWTTSAASVATVSPLGVVTAVAAGTASITASIDGTGGSAIVTVQQVAANVVTITFPGDSIIGTGTLAGTVTLTSGSGQPIASGSVSISSGTPTVATVAPTSGTTDNNGQVAITITGVAAGATSISATSGASSTAQTVRVLAPVQTVVVTAPDSGGAPGHTVTATATLLDANNNQLTGRPVSWSSADPGVATVDPASGLVTAVANGSTTITATVVAEGKSGGMPFTVATPPTLVDSVAVTPATHSMLAGDAFAFTATAFDASGNPMSGVTFTWSVSNAKASVTTAGDLTALDSGTVVLTATTASGTPGVDVSGSATVTIALPPIGSVTFSPQSQNGKPGQQKPFTVTVWNVGATVGLPGRTCDFSTSDANVATVDKSSDVTGPSGTIALVITVASRAPKGNQATIQATCPDVIHGVIVDVIGTATVTVN